MGKNIMNVLSLFNGFSGAHMALEKAGIEINKYYSSEIDKYANKVTDYLFPDIVQLGDITNFCFWESLYNFDFSSIDLIVAGFPCQAWSVAGNQAGLSDARGKLALSLLDVYNEVKKQNPDVLYLFENVCMMKKEHSDFLDGLFGKHMKINSALVSAQNRNRKYWFNWEVEQPEDKNIFIKDIIEDDLNISKIGIEQKARGFNKGGTYIKKSPSLTASTWQENNKLCFEVGKADDIKGHDFLKRIYGASGKSPTLTAICGGNQERKIAIDSSHYRKLTTRECFRLQTVPEKHINKILNAGVSNSQLYKMCGNGFTINVIEHILRCVK